MKMNPMDLGVCGAGQMYCIGSINFGTAGIETGVEVGKIPKNTIITKVVVCVNNAFNAGTTNVLTVGVKEDMDSLMASADVTAGTKGAYQKDVWEDCGGETGIYAQFTQSGNKATAGEADIYVEVVRRPE